MLSGEIHNKFSKQKLNTKRSTETVIIEAGDHLYWKLWDKGFIQAQAYILRRDIYYQDNISAMKLKSNGLSS